MKYNYNQISWDAGENVEIWFDVGVNCQQTQDVESMSTTLDQR